MTDDLDNLRPEIREAVAAIDKGNGVFVNGDDCDGGIAWATARAELLRLAEYEQAAGRLAIEKAELRQCAEQCEAELAAMPDADEWHALRERAERAEAELAALRQKIAEARRKMILNRGKPEYSVEGDAQREIIDMCLALLPLDDGGEG